MRREMQIEMRHCFLLNRLAKRKMSDNTVLARVWGTLPYTLHVGRSTKRNNHLEEYFGNIYQKVKTTFSSIQQFCFFGIY